MFLAFSGHRFFLIQHPTRDPNGDPCRQTAMGEHFVYEAILGSSAFLGLSPFSSSLKTQNLSIFLYLKEKQIWMMLDDDDVDDDDDDGDDDDDDDDDEDDEDDAVLILVLVVVVVAVAVAVVVAVVTSEGFSKGVIPRD